MNSIVTVALVVAALDLLTAAVINIPATGASPFLLIVLLFVALFFLFAYASWRGRRWAYVGGIIVSIFVNLLFGSPTDILYNPANSMFAIAFTFYVATFVAIVYGAYGVFTAKRPMFTLRQIPSFQRSCLCGSRSSNRGPAGWHLCRRDPVETALYGGTTLGYYDTRWSRVSDQGSLRSWQLYCESGVDDRMVQCRRECSHCDEYRGVRFRQPSQRSRLLAHIRSSGDVPVLLRDPPQHEGYHRSNSVASEECLEGETHRREQSRVA